MFDARVDDSVIKPSSSIMRILVANIADENFLPTVPSLEVASGQIQQILRWRVGEHNDIFFSNVADRFVVGAVRIESQHHLNETRRWAMQTYTTL